MPWDLFVRAAGLAHLGIAAGNLLVPRIIEARRTLPAMDPVVRRIFVTHAVYIVGVLAMLGILLLVFPDRLTDGSAFARTCSAMLALFWGARLVIQVAYYGRWFAPRHRAAVLAFAATVAAMTILFGAIALRR